MGKLSFNVNMVYCHKIKVFTFHLMITYTTVKACHKEQCTNMCNVDLQYLWYESSNRTSATYGISLFVLIQHAKWKFCMNMLIAHNLTNVIIGHNRIGLGLRMPNE